MNKHQSFTVPSGATHQGTKTGDYYKSHDGWMLRWSNFAGVWESTITSVPMMLANKCIKELAS